MQTATESAAGTGGLRGAAALSPPLIPGAARRKRDGGGPCGLQAGNLLGTTATCPRARNSFHQRDEQCMLHLAHKHTIMPAIAQIATRIRQAGIRTTHCSRSEPSVNPQSAHVELCAVPHTVYEPVRACMDSVQQPQVASDCVAPKSNQPRVTSRSETQTPREVR